MVRHENGMSEEMILLGWDVLRWDPVFKKLELGSLPQLYLTHSCLPVVSRSPQMMMLWYHYCVNGLSAANVLVGIVLWW